MQSAVAPSVGYAANPGFFQEIILKDFCDPPVTPAEHEPNMNETMERKFMTTLEPKTNLRPTRALSSAAFENFITPAPRTLEQAVGAAVCTVEAGSLKRLSPNDPWPFDQARAVLALLAQCYA